MREKRPKWKLAKDVREEAGRALVSDTTLRRAKAALEVPTRKRKGKSGPWEWGPPLKGWPAGLDRD